MLGRHAARRPSALRALADHGHTIGNHTYTHPGLVKVSPLATWTDQRVDDYLQRRRIPPHPLYLRGYQSIGCAPCTRAVAPGEDPRAGRWWWEQGVDKECGIHGPAVVAQESAG